MDFWNELSKTVTNAADQTVKSTEKLASIAKLKYRLSSMNNKLDDCHRTIGKLYCAENAGEEVTKDAYLPFIEQAAELSENIKACQEELAKLQDFISCPQCQYHIKKGLNYCPKCGSPIK